MPLQTIAQVLAVLIIAGYLTFDKLRENVKRRKYGLAVNPDRCNQHAVAINDLRKQVSELQDCATKIAEKVGIVL
jgi:hypothetical protein